MSYESVRHVEKVHSREAYAREMDFDTALGYLSKIALKHEADEPELVALYGLPDSGKTAFYNKLKELVHEKGKDSQRTSYSINGTAEEDLGEFLRFKGGHPEYKFPILVVSIPEKISEYGDIGFAKTFNRFPGIVIYIYNPKNETMDNSALQKAVETIIRERKKYAEVFKAPYSRPEILFVKNPHAKEKIKKEAPEESVEAPYSFD